MPVGHAVTTKILAGRAPACSSSSAAPLSRASRFSACSGLAASSRPWCTPGRSSAMASMAIMSICAVPSSGDAIIRNTFTGCPSIVQRQSMLLRSTKSAAEGTATPADRACGRSRPPCTAVLLCLSRFARSRANCSGSLRQPSASSMAISRRMASCRSATSSTSRIRLAGRISSIRMMVPPFRFGPFRMGTTSILQLVIA